MVQKDIFEFQRKSLGLKNHFDSKRDAKLGMWRRLMHIIPLGLILCGHYPLFKYMHHYIDELPLATYCLSMVFTNLTAVAKLITYLKYATEFEQLMYAVNTMYHTINDERAKEILRAKQRAARKIVRAYFALVFITGIYFHVEPLVRAAWSFVTGKEIVLKLGMPFRFDFDYLHMPGYAFASFYVLIYLLIICHYASVIDNSFILFAYNLCGHFEALEYFISSNAFDMPHKKQRQCISSFIRYHNQILSMADKLRIIYKPVVFAEFLLVSLLLCVILHQLVTNMTSMSTLIVNGTFLAAVMLQLFIYCYGGEILRNQSEGVAIAIQLSDWYKLTPSNRKMLMFAMARAQKPVIIETGFSEASLENFMAIVKASGSYVTLILSFEN